MSLKEYNTLQVRLFKEYKIDLKCLDQIAERFESIRHLDALNAETEARLILLKYLLGI